jgi:hypothetical protein
MKYLQGFIGKIAVCGGFKSTFVVIPDTPLTLWFRGPQPALAVPSANLIGCSFIPEPTNWDLPETVPVPNCCEKFRNHSRYQFAKEEI